MKHKALMVVIVVVLAAMGLVRAARADVAPPQPPPGASIQSGNPSTYVQMVSESVLMKIADYNGPSLWDVNMELASDKMVGHVEASFNMVNQGAVAETLDVRFPLGTPDGFISVKTIRNFTASVDGQSVETQTIEQEGEWDYQVPWATWQVTFNPGQTVILDVEYDVHPQGYAPWGTFTYVLETGSEWIVKADLALRKGNREEIRASIVRILEERKKKHPLRFPSAGSVFKNPAGRPAGRIVEELGLKGLAVGGARISDVHGNFIVNTGGATAGDVLALMALIREKSIAQKGIALEPEVKVVGEGDEKVP